MASLRPDVMIVVRLSKDVGYWQTKHEPHDDAAQMMVQVMI